MVGKMKKDLQNTKKSFAAMECMIKYIENKRTEATASKETEEHSPSSTRLGFLDTIITHGTAMMKFPISFI